MWATRAIKIKQPRITATSAMPKGNRLRASGEGKVRLIMGLKIVVFLTVIKYYSTATSILPCAQSAKPI
jgi:hypothetical protein